MSKKKVVKKRIKRGLICASAASVVSLAVVAELGRRYEWGPFFYLNFKKREREIVKNYNARKRRGEIIFYGASNFCRWEEMEQDMLPYTVQNHGFGGATDVLLVHYADRLLFPYVPDVAVIQSGSNDYAGLKGKPARQAAASLELKKRMYGYFLENLPDTRFVLLSPLLMPGAPYFTETSLLVSEGMADICRDHPRLCFTDVAGLTYNDGEYRTELFVSDGIHLNRNGQLALKDIVKEVLHGIFEDIRG